MQDTNGEADDKSFVDDDDDKELLAINLNIQGNENNYKY